jgi:hypothetical protein
MVILNFSAYFIETISVEQEEEDPEQKKARSEVCRRGS